MSPRTEGRYHDLREIYESVNGRYFEKSVSAVITWGTGCSRRAVRRRTLGSFSSNTNTIRINPVLDKKNVPRYFVEFVVYHEMLHAHMGCGVSKGRRTVHTKEFRERERFFAQYREALSWEKNSLCRPG